MERNPLFLMSQPISRQPDMRLVPADFYYEPLASILERALRNLIRECPTPGHGGGIYPSRWTDAHIILERCTTGGSERGYG